jgi:PadR family transcriptional regulator, regulatory protein PadR
MITADAQVNRRGYRRRVGLEMWQSQLRKGSLDLAVLASLWDGSLDRPQICCRLEQMAGIDVVHGVIYPILRRLRNARWIETQWVEIEIGHPRQLFCLTTSGREYVSELTRRWREFAGGMNRMLENHDRTAIRQPHVEPSKSIADTPHGEL